MRQHAERRVVIVTAESASAALYADQVSTHCANVTVVRADANDQAKLADACGRADLAVVDLLDAGSRRFDLLGRVRMARPELAVLAMVPPDAPAAADEALAIGAGDVLLKSFGYLDQLACRVRAGLARAHRDATLRDQLAVLIHDHAQLRQEHKSIVARADELETLAAADPLTGLANRRALDERLAETLSAANRHDMPLSVLAIDVDGLKAFNDALGHAAGDEVLRTVARVLRESGRTSDIVARVGGDEFIMLLPHTDAARAMTVAKRVLARFSQKAAGLRRAHHHASATELGVSIGLAERPRGVTADGAALIAAADAALYQAKRSGKSKAVRATVTEVTVVQRSPLAA